MILSSFSTSPNSKYSVKGKYSLILCSTLPSAIPHWVTLVMGLGVRKALKHYSYAWILSKTKMLIMSIWSEKIIFGLLSSCQHSISALGVRGVAGCMGYVLLAGEGAAWQPPPFTPWAHKYSLALAWMMADMADTAESLAFCLLLGIHQGKTELGGDWFAQLILLNWRGEAGVLSPCWQHWSKNQVCITGYWIHMGAEYNAWQD